MPEQNSFGPSGPTTHKKVLLLVEEYEAIRLIDMEGMTQEECADKMKVARTTVQSIYGTARKKLAEAIVEGKPLLITGGSYRLCDGQKSHCKNRLCQNQQSYQKEKQCGG